MFYDRIRYIIEHDDFRSVVIEPIKWKEDVKKFTRHKEYHGVTTVLSGELVFVGNARDFLLGVLETSGVNADVSLTREIKDSQTDIWERDYKGWADFLTYKIDDKKFTIKFNADPTVTLFKSKLSTKIELERLTDLNGESLQPLTLKQLYIEGRDILLVNKLEQDETNKPWFILNSSDEEEYVRSLNIIETGDQDTGIIDVHSQLADGYRKKAYNGYPDECFIGLNEHGITMKYYADVNIKQSFYYDSQAGAITLRLVISILKGIDYEWDRDIVLWEYEGESEYAPKDIIQSFPTQELNLAPNESASLRFTLTASRHEFKVYGFTVQEIGDSGFYESVYVDSQGNTVPALYTTSVSVHEDSNRSPSTSNSVQIFEFAKRLNDIILGVNFKSNTLGRDDLDGYAENGYLSDLTMVHGMWLRGMNEGVDRYKPISTSLQEMLSALNVISPIGVSLTENEFRIENRDYFYQKFVTIKLGEVQNLIITPSEKDYVTKITVGYEKAGGYQEDSGLDEYCRETDYNTVLNKTANELKLLSKYRADGYGLETIRRENPDVGLASDLSENQDSKFDDNIWFVDSNEIPGGDNLEVSNWTKRFSEIPTGLYSPETAMNLWLSPINIMLRHGPWIKAPLLKYIDSMISYNYSEGNSALETRLIDGNRYTQNIGIPVEDFERSADKAMYAEFTAPVTWSQLNGTSYGIPNVYGLAECYYKGERHRGFIEEVSLENGIGDFKIKLYS